MELDQVEIVTAVGALLGAFAGPFTDGEDREPRGQGEGLLRTGEEDVDAEGILRDWQRGEGTDRIGDGDHVRELADDGH